MSRNDEIPLSGGALTTGVVRTGDTVRRPAPERAGLMRDVLRHLERVGFDAAPRWLGVDDQGRDILSWIEGETFTDRSQMHPYIGDPRVRLTFSDKQISAAMRLLRRYHDTFADDDVVVHGDFGPWNLVWRDGVPVAMIDFDNADRGDPSEDMAYALRMFVGYGFASVAPAELARRTRASLAAYGRSFDVPAILEHEYDLAEERCGVHGWDRQLARLPVERAWLARNRQLLEAAATMIRPGTPADAEAVAHVHVETWRAAYAHALPQEGLASLSVDRRIPQHRRAPPIVAEIDGAIVGFVSVGAANDDDADGELYAIYVLPDHWGSGLGRDLIRAGEERLRELGHRDAVLWVLEDNPRARRFYEATGWSLDGTKRPIEIFGVSVPEIRYAKKL